MHRHGYKGSKFGREKDQRRLLLKSLAESLILRESIVTTWPKARAVANYTEKLIAKAKKGDLHSYRQVISALSTVQAADKLINEISPKLADRNSGYFQVTRTSVRRGDDAQLAKVSFVSGVKKFAKTVATSTDTKPGVKPQAEATKVSAQERPGQTISEEQKISQKTGVNQAARRTGRRGNR